MLKVFFGVRLSIAMSRERSRVDALKNAEIAENKKMKNIELYKAQDIAHYVVNKCYLQGEPISNLHLQKMLYFMQIVYASIYDTLLFEDEFEAWPYGPVIRSIYIEYSRYGGSPICRKYNEDSIFKNLGDQNFVDAGIEILREKSPWDLVKITHAKNSPWDIVYNKNNSPKTKISNSLILDAAKKINNRNTDDE